MNWDAEMQRALEADGEKLRQLTGEDHGPWPLVNLAPPCHVCGKSVACWRTEAPREAVCMDCCAGVEHSDGETGHQFEYERGEGYMCRYCSAPPDNDFYDYLNSVGQP